jgi:hypothetical protein
MEYLPKKNVRPAARGKNPTEKYVSTPEIEQNFGKISTLLVISKGCTSPAPQ